MNESQSQSLNDSQILTLLNDRFKEDGVLDTLKLLVRKEILEKIQGESKPKKIKRDFEQKVGDCFIADFLKTHQFYCTYQIFLAECQMNLQDLLETQELLTLSGLGLRDYEDYVYKLSSGTISALEILQKTIKKKYHVEKMDHSCQTETGEESYEEKMKKIERNYLKKIDYSRLNDMLTIEERMQQYSKSCEIKYQTQLELEISRLRDHEINQMRMEERARYEQKLNQLKSGDNEDYQKKLEELKEKEKDALHRLKIKMKMMEEENFKKRNELQIKIDEIEEEKKKFHRHKCLESEEVQREMKELEIAKSKIKKEIQEYQNSRQTLERESQKQAEMQAQFWKEKTDKESKSYKENLKQNNDQDWIAYQKDSCTRLQQQRQYLQEENEFLRNELTEINYKLKIQSQELDKCRQELLVAKDERDIEHNFVQRLEGQLRLIKRAQEIG
ncbi:hypothetical protein pb186bvf_014927 [Paramecium bursaria]